MKVILTRDVPEVGRAGTVLKVSAGHARNFLYPRRLAVEANEGNLRQFELSRKRAQEMADQERDEARALADRLSSVELRYTLKAGKLGQLYGSVSQADIVASLTEKGFEIDRRKVLLKESIKRVGGQNVEIRLLGDIHAKIRVIVEAEEVEGEAEVAAENEEQVIAQSSEPDAEASEEEMVDDGDSEDDESEKNADA